MIHENGGTGGLMEFVSVALTAIHLLAVIAWLGGMIFHIVVLDPVFRKNEVSFQSAYLLALMEGRFRKLAGGWGGRSGNGPRWSCRRWRWASGCAPSSPPSFSVGNGATSSPCPAGTRRGPCPLPRCG